MKVTSFRHHTDHLEPYSSTIFCSWYCQLIIVILTIISVIVEQSNRNNQIPYVQPGHDQSPVQKSTSGDWSTMYVRAPYQNHYYRYLFSKFKTKQDDWAIFWWIFNYVCLLKLQKDDEDDNHYSVFQIDIVSSKKYCNLMSIISNEYSTMFIVMWLFHSDVTLSCIVLLEYILSHSAHMLLYQQEFIMFMAYNILDMWFLATLLCMVCSFVFCFIHHRMKS